MACCVMRRQWMNDACPTISPPRPPETANMDECRFRPVFEGHALATSNNRKGLGRVRGRQMVRDRQLGWRPLTLLIGIVIEVTARS